VEPKSVRSLRLQIKNFKKKKDIYRSKKGQTEKASGKSFCLKEAFMKLGPNQKEKVGKYFIIYSMDSIPYQYFFT